MTLLETEMAVFTYLLHNLLETCYKRVRHNLVVDGHASRS